MASLQNNQSWRGPPPGGWPASAPGICNQCWNPTLLRTAEAQHRTVATTRLPSGTEATVFVTFRDSPRGAPTGTNLRRGMPRTQTSATCLAIGDLACLRQTAPRRKPNRIRMWSWAKRPKKSSDHPPASRSVRQAHPAFAGTNYPRDTRTPKNPDRALQEHLPRDTCCTPADLLVDTAAGHSLTLPRPRPRGTAARISSRLQRRTRPSIRHWNSWTGTSYGNATPGG